MIHAMIFFIWACQKRLRWNQYLQIYEQFTFDVLQCFDTVGWVIWPVKPVPGMTYNVFSETLNPTQSMYLVPRERSGRTCVCYRFMFVINVGDSSE